MMCIDKLPKGGYHMVTNRGTAKVERACYEYSSAQKVFEIPFSEVGR